MKPATKVVAKLVVGVLLFGFALGIAVPSASAAAPRPPSLQERLQLLAYRVDGVMTQVVQKVELVFKDLGSRN